MLRQLLSGLGEPFPPWPAESEGVDADDAWISRGEAYALAVRLLRLQLRHGEQRIKSAVDKLLCHLASSAGINGWDKWLVATIWPEVNIQTMPANWIFSSMANDNPGFSPAQLLGAILTLAADQELSSAISGIRYLAIYNCLESGKIAILLRLTCDSFFANHSESFEISAAPAWLKEIDVHRKLATLLKASSILDCYEQYTDQGNAEMPQAVSKLFGSNLVFRDTPVQGKLSQSAACLKLEFAKMLVRTGKQTEGVHQIEQLVKTSNITPPPGTHKSSWQQLLINSALISAQDMPELLLIESKSLPRSGHHYLKDVLQVMNIRSFSYCEMYQEPGCCKVSPCNAEPFWNNARCQGRAHTRLVKSHDFQLSDPIYDPPLGVIRIVQIRQPYFLLPSWLELAQLDLNKTLLADHGINLGRIYLYHEKPLLDLAYKLIDESGITMGPGRACDWIKEKTNYITHFSQKWFPLCKPILELSNCQSGTFLLRYEDLGRVPRLLFRTSKCQPDPKNKFPTLPEFTPRTSPIIERRSKRISSLLNAVDSAISASAAHILLQWSNWDNLTGYG